MLKTHATHESKPLTTSAITTINVPPGGKINSLVLRFATSGALDVSVAAVKSEITNIRLTLNGKDIVNASPTKLFDLYAHLGQRVDSAAGLASVLELNVGRLFYVDPSLREVFGFGTVDVQSIQIAITAGTLSTISTCQAHTERTSVTEKLGTYCRFINYSRSFNSASDDIADTLPRDPDSVYLALLVDSGASGTLTDSELRLGSFTLREKTKKSVNAQYLSNNGYSQQAGYYSHFFTDGAVNSRLVMAGVNDLRVVNTFTVAPGAAGYNISALTAINLVIPGEVTK